MAPWRDEHDSLYERCENVLQILKYELEVIIHIITNDQDLIFSSLTFKVSNMKKQPSDAVTDSNFNFCRDPDLSCICYSSGWGENSQSGPPFRVRITIWFCSLLVALGAGNDGPQAGVWRVTTKPGKTAQECQRPTV